MKTLTCREHGGTFQVTPSRGRPPTRCGGKNPLCNKAHDTPTNISTGKPVSRVERTASTIKNKRMAEHSSRVAPDEERIREAEKPKPVNVSVTQAMAAKAALEAQGWLCKGRGGLDEHYWAELTATRGDELLVMRWVDAECVSQEYSLWGEKPSANNKPATNLGFDPDECSDRELVRILSGSKVTWWNSLGQFEMHGIIDTEKIRVEHLYNGRGDETPGDRIIHFIDRGGGGFRAFRLGALLKVG